MPYPRVVLATGRGAWLSVIVIIMLIPLSNIAPVIVKGVSRIRNAAKGQESDHLGCCANGNPISCR
jgi:hypothetical protein